MLDKILFLPDIYPVGAVISGIIIGWLFGRLLTKQVLASAAVLFLIYSMGQFIFRVIEDDQPLRLAGQVIYYMIFLTFLWLGSKLAHVKETRR